MKTSFKKLLAWASIISLVLMNSIFVSANTEPTGVLDDGDIVITDDRFELWQEVTDLTVYVNEVEILAWLTIIEDTLTIAWNYDSTTVLNVTYSYNDGTLSFVWAVVVQWADDHSVTVSATILPILTLSLSKNDISFGELEVWTPNTDSLDVITTSNASSGISVVMTSRWLATWNTANDFHIWTLAYDDSVAVTWASSYQVNGSNMLDSQSILNTINVATSNATTPVNLSVEITAQAEAWNYTDVLVFSATWKF